MRWETYVVQDDRLAACPLYMEERLSKRGVQRGTLLSQR